MAGACCLCVHGCQGGGGAPTAGICCGCLLNHWLTGILLFRSDGAQHTSSGTCKDNWIDYKGKALPPGPEVRRGRPGLTETFQQGSNPYEVRPMRLG